jgi:hypothetical protein
MAYANGIYKTRYLNISKRTIWATLSLQTKISFFGIDYSTTYREIRTYLS